MSKVSAEEAVQLLRSHEVVAVPTETVYGLAGRIDSDLALKKIFSIKQRPSFDPLIVHVQDVQTARGLCREWPEIYDLLVASFWPGPLTLIAPKAACVSSLITSGLDCVGVRQPSHPLTLSILEKLAVPLAAPSANRFGHTSPTTAEHVEQEFSVPVVDGGPCSLGLESTVLQAAQSDGRWDLTILRPGAVARSQLRAVLERAGVRYQLTRAHSNAAPGHLKAHYQPASPVVLLKNKRWSAEIHSAVERHLGHPIGDAVELQLPPTPQEAARVLYEDLRR